MSVFEFLLLFATAYLGYFTRFQEFPNFIDYLPTAMSFALLLVVAMMAMGVYESKLREGYTGMMLRTAVSIFLLGTMAVAILAFFIPALEMGRGVLMFSALEGFVLVAVSRWLTNSFIDEDVLKKRVLILGSGNRALKIASRMRRRSDRRAFLLLGFMQQDGAQDLVSQYGAEVIKTDESIRDYCQQNRVDEVVVAIDERRRNRDSSAPGLPVDDLVQCRLDGVEICEIQAFIEREAGKVDVDLLQPSWMVFSDGFVSGIARNIVKRVFDLLASIALLLVAWPIMLFTAFFIGIGSFFKEPILYRQERVGLDGKPFNVMKFRSMRTDAEAQGAMWAVDNDPRVTRIGAFIRKTRIDELPQLFNVIKGEMSFVGPRPERPVFVDDLNEKIPYYAERHRVKPGLTGWAQLCYPYGASVEDAKQKLQYDLYYLKNHSFLLDLIILLQTVEVVLVGEGAR